MFHVSLDIQHDSLFTIGSLLSYAQFLSRSLLSVAEATRKFEQPDFQVTQALLHLVVAIQEDLVKATRVCRVSHTPPPSRPSSPDFNNDSVVD